MKYAHLVLANLKRKKLRTLFTLLSIFVAFTLYGILNAVRAGFGQGIELTGMKRLVMINKISLIQPLPISYRERIAADEGVEHVTYAVWFNGIYQDPKNFFATMAVDPETWLAVHPELRLPPEQREAWLRTRTGAIVGEKTAARYGFEVGDRIPLTSPLFRRDGGWDFTIEGIFDSPEKSFDTTPFYFHYDYLTEGGATYMNGRVGWYVLEVVDPEEAAAVADRLDRRFANSAAETETSTEDAFIKSFANQAGNVVAIVAGVLAVVFFTMLLVAGNTMAQSVRERIQELGVLKTLGFRGGTLMALVLAESLFLTVLAGGLGLGAVTWATWSFDLGGGMFPTFFVTGRAVAVGAVLVVVLGVVAGAVPALQAQRLRIVDALARRA